MVFPVVMSRFVEIVFREIIVVVFFDLDLERWRGGNYWEGLRHLFRQYALSQVTKIGGHREDALRRTYQLPCGCIAQLVDCFQRDGLDLLLWCKHSCRLRNVLLLPFLTGMRTVSSYYQRLPWNSFNFLGFGSTRYALSCASSSFFPCAYFDR